MLSDVINPVQNSLNGSFPEGQSIRFQCLAMIIFSNVYATWLCHATEQIRQRRPEHSLGNFFS